MTNSTGFTLDIRRAYTDRKTDRHMVDLLCVPWDAVSMLTEHRHGEMFRRGAFHALVTNPQAWPKIRLTDSHAPMSERRPVAKAVEFSDEPDGLWARFQMFDTPTGREAWENLSEGTYGGASIGFEATEATPGVGGVREIRAAKLHHVSLVDEPAYQEAKVLALRRAIGTNADDDLRAWFREHPAPRSLPTLHRAARIAPTKNAQPERTFNPHPRR